MTAIVGKEFPTTEPPTLIAGRDSQATRPRVLVTRAMSPTIGLVTLSLDGGGEVTVCFWKMFFYQVFKGKTFYIKDFIVRKMFYNF